MKQKFPVLLLFFTLLLSCTKTEKPLDGFLVQGEIKGLGNEKITVIKFGNNSIGLDSIFPKNDRFTYTGKVKEPYFVQLLVKTSDSTSTKLTEFMIENSKILIEGNDLDYDEVKVRGSNSDKVLKAYLDEDELLNNKWDALKIEYDEAVSSNDTVQRKSLAKQLNTIYKIDRVNLLKDYVKAHSNTTVGALLPAFCTIGGALDKNDYQELYSYLSDSIKVSDYGKNILEKSLKE